MKGCFGSIVLIGFLSLFIVVGGVMMWFGMKNVQEARESVNWPSTEGVVTSSELTRDSNSDGDTTYKADIVYQYEVEGVEWSGDRLNFDMMTSTSRSDAENLLRKYPVETVVQVFYHPDTPEKATLATGVTGFSWLLPGMGLVFIIVPGLILLGAIARLIFR